MVKTYSTGMTAYRHNSLLKGSAARLILDPLVELTGMSSEAQMLPTHFITAQSHASAVHVYAAVVCVCVCLSISLSQVSVLLKRLNAGSRKQRHTTAQKLCMFSGANNLGKTQMGSPPMEAPNAGGVG